MNAIVFLLPLAVLLGGVFAAMFIAAASRGQFDTLDEEGRRILEDG
ncbi:MAG: cbb3-type cytochrome oxidase assembly protein CcoS [Myxococcota bacterium]